MAACVARELHGEGFFLHKGRKQGPQAAVNRVVTCVSMTRVRFLQARNIFERVRNLAGNNLIVVNKRTTKRGEYGYILYNNPALVLASVSLFISV